MNPSVGTLTTSGLYTAPAAISSAQNITITATSVADPTKSANATVTLSTATNSATFVTLDTTTQGNWKSVYGSNGYNVINDTVAYPSYVTVTPSGVNAPHTWVGSSTDVRALLKAASSTDRIAAAWYNSSPFLIDMVFNDGLQHRVAIYCLDWDTTTRAETIDVLDANGVVLNTQQVSNFLQRAVSGVATIRPRTDSGDRYGRRQRRDFGTVLRYYGACQQLYAHGAEWRSAEHSFNQLYSDAEWHLQRHDYDHAVGGRFVDTDNADVQQLCCPADVHDYTDSGGAGDAYTEQQRLVDQSSSPDLCDTARRTDDRNSDGRQWAGHGIVHGSGEHGWVTDHKL